MNPTPSTPLPTPRSSGTQVASNLHACQIISGRDVERVAKQIDAAIQSDLATARSEASLATAALARSEERVKELQEKYDCEEEAHGKTISQRDQAEEAADKMASAILGESIDWSDHEGKWEEAIEAIAALTDKLARSERELAEWKEELGLYSELRLALKNLVNIRGQSGPTWDDARRVLNRTRAPEIKEGPNHQPLSREAALATSLREQLAERTKQFEVVCLHADQLTEKLENTEARLAIATAELANAKDDITTARKAAGVDMDEFASATTAVKTVQSQLAAATARCGELEGTSEHMAASLEIAGKAIHVTNVEHGNYRRCPICRGENGEHDKECVIGQALGHYAAARTATANAATIAKASAAGGLAGEGKS